MLASATTDDIELALDRQGVSVRRLVLLSPPNAQKGGRCVYRVDAGDGRTIKARRLESEEAARRLVDLRSRIDVAFTPIIAQHGAVLLEAWIDGTLLTDLDPPARAAEAGGLLARLHATALDSEGREISTRAWRVDAGGEIRRLAAAGNLPPAEARRLAAELRARDPGRARIALVHRDFCAENMLIDRRGCLRVIDNEWLAIAPAEYDLGRTFSRWPMSDATEHEFLRAYGAAAGHAPSAVPFWRMVAAAQGTRIRSVQDPDRFEAALAHLRRSL